MTAKTSNLQPRTSNLVFLSKKYPFSEGRLPAPATALPMDTLVTDLRYALRTLRTNRGYTAVAVLCLALGLGINTTIFGAINGMLLRPLGYQDPDRLVRVWSSVAKTGDAEMEVSVGDIADFRDRNRTLDGIALYNDRTFSLGGNDAHEAAHVEGEVVSWNTFQLLGVRPILGRAFLEAESVAGQHHVVLLGYDVWIREFGGDRDVLGKPALLDGTPYTVVGVMPPRMRFPNTKDAWVPLAVQGAQNRAARGWNALARLKPNVSIGQADDDVRRIAATLAAEHQETNAGIGARVVSFRTSLVDEYRAVLWTMLGAVFFVLLIACGNVANLLLARAVARQKEIAIRTALGATRWRLVRQLLTESLLVAVGGGVLGLFIVLWGNDLVVAAIPYELPFWMRFDPDWRVFGYLLGACVFTAILFGLVPALQATRTDVQTALKEGGRGTTMGRGGGRLRGALVVGEVALCLVLLVGGTLMMRSFVNLRLLDPGFRTANVLTTQLMLPGTRYDDVGARGRFFTRLLDRVGVLPGVERAALISYLPLSGSNTGASFDVEGRSFAPAERPQPQVRAISGAYFQALDIPLRAGRTFTARELGDTAAGDVVTVVNETMAKQLWPGASALGRRLRWGEKSPWMEVVGVVADVRQRKLNERPAMQLYLPYAGFARRGMTLIVRSAATQSSAVDPAQLTPAVRAVVRELDPVVPVFETMTLDAVRVRSTWDSRLFSSMFLIFGLVALFLASMGLYAVMSYSVTQRTHEIGVRVALGAQVRDVLTLVVGGGARLAGVGVGVGLALAFGVTRLLRGMLFGISASDPLSFVGIAALLTIVAVVASYLPARRAARVDPMAALRSE